MTPYDLEYGPGDQACTLLEGEIVATEDCVEGGLAACGFDDACSVGYLAVLRLRGVEPSPEERAVIEACEDTGRLSVWVARAPEVERVAEMLDA